jgi:hypothetical protein
VRAAVLLAALAGCGRLGFGDVMTATDAAVDSVAPDPDAPAPPSITSLSIPSATAATTTFAPIPGAMLDLPPSPGTTWLLLVSATLDSTTGGEPAAEARYLVDGVERGLGGTQNIAPSQGGPWQHFAVIAGTTAPQRVAFELRDVSGGTATIRDLFAAGIPLPPGAAAGMQHGAVDPLTTVTSSAPMQVASFTFTPAGPGPYLVLGLANASDAPGESDIYVQWRDSDGVLGRDAQLPRRPWQSMMWAWVVPSPSATEYSLWAHRGSGDSSLQYIRWLAVPLDAFAGYAHASAPAFASTAGVAPLPLATAPAPTITGAASRWLYLASAVVGEGCEGVPLAARQIAFTAGAAALPAIAHTTDNCATELTSGVFALLPSPPPSASIAIASGNGRTVQAWDATVVVLGLP